MIGEIMLVAPSEAAPGQPEKSLPSITAAGTIVHEVTYMASVEAARTMNLAAGFPEFVRIELHPDDTDFGGTRLPDHLRRCTMSGEWTELTGQSLVDFWDGFRALRERYAQETRRGE